MRIGIATVQVPFITGGAEIHVRLLKEQLEHRGHVVDLITIPFKWYPPQVLLNSIKAVEYLDLTEVNGQKIDLLITMKFPMYYINHANKVAWILHQHRQAYELYETEHSDLHLTDEGRKAAHQIRNLDTQMLSSHKKLFTNSKNVANRLWLHNRLHAEPLYHPPEDHEQLFCETYGDYILVPGRLDVIKRQSLIVEALAHHTTHKLILIGNADTPYGDTLRKRIKFLGIEDRVLVKGFVSREEKVNLYANALAVYNGAYDEDYGYVTLESFFSSKPVITHTDSGGPLEFVIDQENGFIVSPSPTSIATVLDDLTIKKAQELGNSGRKNILDLDLNWDFIIDALILEQDQAF